MNDPALERIDEHLDAVALASGEPMTLAEIQEADYQRRAAQLARWQKLAEKQRQDMAQFEAETMAFLEAVGW